MTDEVVSKRLFENIIYSIRKTQGKIKEAFQDSTKKIEAPTEEVKKLKENNEERYKTMKDLTEGNKSLKILLITSPLLTTDNSPTDEDKRIGEGLFVDNFYPKATLEYLNQKSLVIEKDVNEAVSEKLRRSQFSWEYIQGCIGRGPG